MLLALRQLPLNFKTVLFTSLSVGAFVAVRSADELYVTSAAPTVFKYYLTIISYYEELCLLIHMHVDEVCI